MASVKRAEATKKKMQILGGKEKNLKAHRNLRADVAKILTLVREKEILEKVQPEVKQEETKEQKGKKKA
jgi:hypothetical protein